MLITLKDGGIVDIKEAHDSISGCPTCDYGSVYTNEITILLTHSTIYVSVSQMYKYKFSSGDIMKIFLPNIDKISDMTEQSFTEWFRGQINKISAEAQKYDHLVIEYSVYPKRSK